MLQRKPSFPAVAFGTVFLAVTGLFTYSINYSIARQHAAATEFQPVPARVLESRVASNSSGSGGSRSTSYSPRIRYRYQVSGEEFESHRYWYTGVGFNSRQAADAVVQQYPQGSRVLAYYDTADPSESVLNNSPPPTNSLLGVISLFWVVGFVIIGLGIYGRRQKANAAARSSVATERGAEPLEAERSGV